MEKYTRETQKLIYWLISDFANFWNGNPVGSTPSDYQMFQAKKSLKQEFLKLFKYKQIKKPISKYLEVLEDKDNKSIDELKNCFIKAIQSIFINNDDFSLALELLSQDTANKFVAHLYELAIDNGVGLRKEIVDLFHQQQEEKFIFIHLLKKKCVICGRHADLDHYDNVSRIGGYKYDTGKQLRYLPLCREHHSIRHGMTRPDFEKRYGYKGIYLNQKQVEMLAPIYKGHFRANEIYKNK